LRKIILNDNIFIGGNKMEVTEADVFLGMLERAEKRAEKRAEEAKVKDSEKEEKLVEKIELF